MKKDVRLLLLVGLIVFSTSLLLGVECVSFIDIGVLDHLENLPEELYPIAATARGDAYTDVGTVARFDVCLWLSGGFCLGFSGGCLLGSVGVVGAGFYNPSPPPTRLLGKSPEYIEFYMARYKQARKRVALSGACLGCIAGAVTAGCLVTPWAAALGTFVGRIADERGW